MSSPSAFRLDQVALQELVVYIGGDRFCLLVYQADAQVDHAFSHWYHNVLLPLTPSKESITHVIFLCRLHL
jgi:hypothetical protein